MSKQDEPSWLIALAGFLLIFTSLILGEDFSMTHVLKGPSAWVYDPNAHDKTVVLSVPLLPGDETADELVAKLMQNNSDVLKTYKVARAAGVREGREQSHAELKADLEKVSAERDRLSILAGPLTRMTPDELRVARRFIDKMMGEGRAEYGELNLATDTRTPHELASEALDECLDSMAYVAMALGNLELSTKSCHTCLGQGHVVSEDMETVRCACPIGRKWLEDQI